jgi:serine/threonine-protein kinase
MQHERVLRLPSEAAARPLTLSSLPPSILAQSRVHLSWLAGAAIVAVLAVVPLAAWLQPEAARAMGLPSFRAALALVLLSSAAMIGMVLAGRIAARAVLMAGLAYEVLIGAAIALFENSVPWDPDDFARGGSSLTLWLAAFAFLVPMPPRHAVVAALAAAACGPALHYALSPALSLPLAPPARLAIYYIPAFLMAVAAGLVNARVLRLEWEAARVRELGSYELEEVIARGGMGEVWRARHRLLKRPAAVKLIRAGPMLPQQDPQSASLRLRFEQEARAISVLRSPHTVAIYDFGAAADGSLYYAMELLEGLDLGELVRRFGPQCAGRVIHILMQACESLEEAHARGLVHRDIKPANLFLCRLGTTCDFVKLLDFGLVKRFLAADSALLTMEGAAVGTPAFMAPEIALGEKRIDGRADLYGLGCVAFWLLTGRTVFEEDNPTAMALAHVQKQPAPPSQCAEVEVPAGLDALVLQCLAKNPEDRPSSAADLRRRLRVCAAAAPWSPEDAEQWWRVNMPRSLAAPI